MISCPATSYVLGKSEPPRHPYSIGSLLPTHALHRPPGGEYIPPSTTVAPAQPTVYTTIATPTAPVHTDTVPNCGKYYTVIAGDLCDMVAMKFSITVDHFRALNPSLNAECTNLFLGYDYCVGLVNGTTITTAAPTSSTTTPSAPSTKQSGLVNGTNITTAAPTSSTTTPSVPSTKQSGLVNGTNITTAAPTSSTTTPSPSSTTQFLPPSGPTQSGATTKCRQWYTVQSGDDCWVVQQRFGITFAQIRQWNPSLDESCSNMWLGHSYCVAGP